MNFLVLPRPFPRPFGFGNSCVGKQVGLFSLGPRLLEVRALACFEAEVEWPFLFFALFELNDSNMLFTEPWREPPLLKETLDASDPAEPLDSTES